MAQRTTCLCDGKYIGIESIFTVINGKQINIPDKVEELREKSRHNQLLCPCGCGAHLILVAGERNLREQHFRLKDGELGKDCRFVTEGKESVDSKIVLKCWLDDKLKDENIESRVPIATVDETDRKYEFTLLSRNKAIAVSYSYDCANLSDEKFDVLEGNSQNIKIIYVVDECNGGINAQYPENRMKIQKRQGYCLYLSIECSDYYKAKLRAAFFDQNIAGLWQEISFASGLISLFEIDEQGDILYAGKPLKNLLDIAKDKFDFEKECTRYRREREKLEREEEQRKIQEENAKRQEDWKKEKQRLREEAKRVKAEQAEKQRIETEKNEQEMKQKDAVGDFENQETQIKDSAGNRWIKCEFCGKIGVDKEFSSYGGAGKINLGTCYDCARNNPDVHKKMKFPTETKKIAYDPMICPDCGGQLKEKKGRYGIFIGCDNYPECTYTRQIKKK